MLRLHVQAAVLAAGAVLVCPFSAAQPVACISSPSNEPIHCTTVAANQEATGEGCDYLTRMGNDCSGCTACPGGYLMDMPPPPAAKGHMRATCDATSCRS
eukprot:SAG22_NODE_12611_length_436_cov_0.792285_1_plen_99_part_01